ncbi:MAG: hypothetical protein A2X36_16275 [Elusimicrobia bacterium GWA2_69_24]|nr:MAG: hypothetical protein A2X36_16275 [Elusimicrobia bacterium GWA2_69_24]HBL19110.1 hypothetical protein [Elusimicrobiota bacterium]
MDILRAAAPGLIHSFISLIGRTSRARWEGLEHFEAARQGGQGFIYAFWHQRQALLTFTHRDMRPVPAVLVSRSRDGEIIAGVMSRFGIDAVRGSSSRGASAATLELLDILAAGRPAGITPDGPKGPARVVKPGVLYLAQKSGCPILPLGCSASRRIEFSRAWDRFHAPLPFGRIALVYGPPLRVAPGDDIAERGSALKAALDRVTEEADRLAG